MKFNPLLILFAIFVTLSDSLTAEETADVRPYTLAELLARAEKRNKDIANAQLDLLDKTILAWGSLNYLYPSSMGFSGSLSSGYDWINNRNKETKFGMSFNFGYSLNADLFMKITENIHNKSKVKREYLSVLRDKKAEISKLAFRILLKQEEPSYKNLQFRNVTLRYERALIQFKKGEISEIDKLTEEYAFKSIGPELEKLEIDYKILMGELKLLADISLSETIEITEPLDTFYNEALNELSFSSELNAAVMLKKDEMKSREILRNKTIAAIIPSLSLDYNIGFNYNRDLVTGNFSGTSNSEWSNDQSLTLRFSIPLKTMLPFHKEQIDLISSNIALQKSRNDLDYEIRKQEIGVNNQLAVIEQLKKSIEPLRFNFELSEKILKLTERNFHEGNASAQDVEDKEKLREEARLRLNNALYELYKTKMDLKKMFE